MRHPHEVSAYLALPAWTYLCNDVGKISPLIMGHNRRRKPCRFIVPALYLRFGRDRNARAVHSASAYRPVRQPPAERA
jgi:hypothetical protein